MVLPLLLLHLDLFPLNIEHPHHAIQPQKPTGKLSLTTQIRQNKRHKSTWSSLMPAFIWKSNVHSVQCTLQCTVHSVQCTVYSVQCIEPTLIFLEGCMVMTNKHPSTDSYWREKMLQKWPPDGALQSLYYFTSATMFNFIMTHGIIQTCFMNYMST